MIAILALILPAGCNRRGPMTPSPPPAIMLACPADVEIQAARNGRATLVYTPPVAQGGVAPVTTTCNPAPGATLRVGDTQVRCTARDAAQQTAVCTFRARITPPPPRLRFTRFLAFGDSITEGKLSRIMGSLILPPIPISYPFKLQGLLAARYSDQTIEVLNDGLAGETAGQGRNRLPRSLAETRPQVVMLLEGINGLTDDGVSHVARNLRDMVDTAKESRVEVMIATLPPITDARERFAPAQREIRELNQIIFDIAAEKGVGPPVDLFRAFGTDASLFGADGLHPTDAGYTLMARTFFDAIVARFEAQPSATLTGLQAPNIVWQPVPGPAADEWPRALETPPGRRHQPGRGDRMSPGKP